MAFAYVIKYGVAFLPIFPASSIHCLLSPTMYKQLFLAIVKFYIKVYYTDNNLAEDAERLRSYIDTICIYLL